MICDWCPMDDIFRSNFNIRIRLRFYPTESFYNLFFYFSITDGTTTCWAKRRGSKCPVDMIKSVKGSCFYCFLILNLALYKFCFLLSITLLYICIHLRLNKWNNCASLRICSALPSQEKREEKIRCVSNLCICWQTNATTCVFLRV